MHRPIFPSIGALALVALACPALLGNPLFAQVPEPVEEMSWCADAKNCLTWSAAPGALDYRLYRGTHTGLPGLLGATPDGCIVGTYSATVTGALPEPPPAAGELHWYLVTARNEAGEGGSGSATAGLRQIDDSGDCVADARLVLNEVDYDQPGIDVGEFVEISNVGSAERDLTHVALILINGGTGAEYARVLLAEAAPSLAGGSRMVIGTETVLSKLPPGVPAATFASLSNNIQNGAPDGVALVDLATGLLLDSVAYEGAIAGVAFDGVAGTFDLRPAAAADSSTVVGSLARVPDGGDETADDWQFVGTPTPGQANPNP